MLNDVSSILVSLIYFIKRFRCAVHIVFQVLCVHISRFKRRKEIVAYIDDIQDWSQYDVKRLKDKLKETVDLHKKLNPDLESDGFAPTVILFIKDDFFIICG